MHLERRWRAAAQLWRRRLLPRLLHRLVALAGCYPWHFSARPKAGGSKPALCPPRLTDAPKRVDGRWLPGTPERPCVCVEATPGCATTNRQQTMALATFSARWQCTQSMTPSLFHFHALGLWEGLLTAALWLRCSLGVAAAEGGDQRRLTARTVAVQLSAAGVLWGAQ
jgi:hypothetical protein